MITSCPSRSLVDRHFAGTITARAERDLRGHLSGCEACRERYERHLLLARLDRRVPAMQDRLARGLGISPPPRTRSRWVGLVLGLAAATAVLAMWVRLPAPAPREFRPRGIAAPDADQALLIYRIAPGSPPRAVLDGVIERDDELAFAYRNRGGWPRLLVYAVDEAQRVYWYHPGWTEATATPTAIAIEAGPERHELAEAVAQPLRPGRLWIHAVFTDEPIDVRAVERGVRPARAEELVTTLTVMDARRERAP